MPQMLMAGNRLILQDPKTVTPSRPSTALWNVSVAEFFRTVAVSSLTSFDTECGFPPWPWNSSRVLESPHLLTNQDPQGIFSWLRVCLNRTTASTCSYRPRINCSQRQGHENLKSNFQVTGIFSSLMAFPIISQLSLVISWQFSVCVIS